MARADESAFPPHPDRNYAAEKNECGMTMREWYAGQALPEVIAQWDKYFRHSEDAEGDRPPSAAGYGVLEFSPPHQRGRSVLRMRQAD